MSANLYRAYAQECLHFAVEMTPSSKVVLLEMARYWLRLAEQAEKNAANQSNGLRGDVLLDPPGT